ncbi:MAG TPA: NfeD family protein [Caulifigura sp.]|nr:NfeD family protein [Caulifigura sp.]
MDYVSLAFLLAVLGFALIIAELFIPSGGLITVGCIVCFVASIWFAYRGWWESSQGIFWTFSSSLLVGIPIFLLGLLRLIETTRLGDRILLAAPKAEEVVPHQAEQDRLEKLVGKKGRTLSMLNPGGMVMIDGQRQHAFSEGIMIDPNEWVEVLEARGLRLLVRRTAAPVLPPLDPPGSTAPASGPEATARADDQLDFDLPQS